MLKAAAREPLRLLSNANSIHFHFSSSFPSLPLRNATSSQFSVTYSLFSTYHGQLPELHRCRIISSRSSPSPTSQRRSKILLSKMAALSETVRTASSSAVRRDTPWGGVMAQSPKFTQLVVKSMRELFPEELADRSWDNVGLLLDNIETPESPHRGRSRVLLTNDLTYQVAEEAVEWGASVIISYHPIIFRPLKAITTADPQQATLLLLASNRIAVYSPHTALDASPRGINAWLAETALNAAKQSVSPNDHIKVASKHVLRPIPDPSGQEPNPKEGPQTGYGVIATLNEGVPALRVIQGLGRLLGGLKHLSVAEPVGCDLHHANITSIAVCAGSGGDVLRGCEAQLWVTGEMSHHEALAATQRGKIVVTTYHSNTERKFLDFKLRAMLKESLRDAGEEEVEVEVSRWDRDPFRTLEVETS